MDQGVSREESPNPGHEANSLCFVIDLLESDSPATNDGLTLDPEINRAFHRDGFVRIDQPILTQKLILALQQRLEEVLRGRYSTGVPPKRGPRILKSEYVGSPHIRPPLDLSHLSISERKATIKPSPQAIVGPLGTQKGSKRRVLQIINTFQADTIFRSVALDPRLGQCVAQIAGWKTGVRLGSDQVWAKPPGAGPLAWHRDGPYFMFTPRDVVTVWIALDDMDEACMGPLRYIRGSHLWQDEDRVGAYDGFLGDTAPPTMGVNDSTSDATEEIVSMLGLPAGALSIHHGRTWHGSSGNTSLTRPRRGFGIHYVPAHVKFTKEAAFSKLWRPYVAEAKEGDPSYVPLPEADFPLVWRPSIAEG